MDFPYLLLDNIGVKYDTFSSNKKSRDNDEQWITLDESHYDSELHADDGNSGTVIRGSRATIILQALCISLFITNSLFLYFPVFTLH